ncbi:MAG: serine/threonine protein kinase [Sandaracinaceae bacterium]|nr:serine/threonine protein kinase [Sandaracinaceae bacterium]
MGGYELRERLGEGGMGEVWRAHDARLGRDVAIKRIAKSVGLHEEYAVRMKREARALAGMQHPTLVTIYDIQTDASDSPFIVMELLEGETVGSWVERHPGAGGNVVIPLLLPVLDGLAAAHRAGIVHRDLKPDNLFLVRGVDGTLHPKVIDFGIASIEELGSNLTTGPLGTPAYMAPEQITLGSPIGPYTDIWSMCVCLYAAAVGQSPFDHGSVAEIFRRVREAPLPFPRNGTLDGPLFSILARGTRKQPSERFQTMGELKEALVLWQQGRTVTGPPRASTTPPPQPAQAATDLDRVIQDAFGKKP